ncbi:hypothetical protein PM082_023366 [Marasmius tenuissimus]|nr:hypothetical protein PM082_023366 [Marasmius tenuissimus]
MVVMRAVWGDTIPCGHLRSQNNVRCPPIRAEGRALARELQRQTHHCCILLIWNCHTGTVSEVWIRESRRSGHLFLKTCN